MELYLSIELFLSIELYLLIHIMWLGSLRGVYNYTYKSIRSRIDRIHITKSERRGCEERLRSLSTELYVFIHMHEFAHELTTFTLQIVSGVSGVSIYRTLSMYLKLRLC